MSTYIKLSTLEYPRHIGDIQIDPAGMDDYAPVEWVDAPIINSQRERASIAQPINKDGAWVTSWSVVPIPDSEQAEKVRIERNAKLAASDWTQGKDIPDNVSSAWAAYRQALRDITVQAGFPWGVQWPTQPE
jgi:hypothetical protein